MNFFGKIKSLISNNKGTDEETKGLDNNLIAPGVTNNSNTIQALMKNRDINTKIQYLRQQNKKNEADALIIEDIWQKMTKYEYKIYNFDYAISYVEKNASLPVYHQFMKDVLKKRPEEKNFGGISMWTDQFINFLKTHKNIYDEELKQFLSKPPEKMTFSHIEAVANMVYGEAITTNHEEIVKKYCQKLIDKKIYHGVKKFTDSEKRSYLFGKEIKEKCIQREFAEAIKSKHIHGVVTLYEKYPDLLERKLVVDFLASQLAEQKRKNEFKGHWFTVGCEYRLPIYIKYGVIDEKTALFAKQQYVLGGLESGSNLDLPIPYDIKSYTHGYIPPRVYAKHFGIDGYITSRDKTIIDAAKQGVRALFSELGQINGYTLQIHGKNGQSWNRLVCNSMIKYLDFFKLWNDKDMSEIVTYYTTYIKPHNKVA